MNFFILPERSGVEQHFSKADRCFHEGRFGPKAADTERRCMSVLGITNMDDERKIIAGARILYAKSVKTYKGKQKERRMDKGVAKAKKESSERTWLQNKTRSLQKAMAALPETPSRDDLPESAKQVKELALQRKRRLDRATEAADNGYLLREDEGLAPFAQSAAKRRKSLQQDEKRIEKMALSKMCWKNTSRPQLWNWKSLGAVKTWCAAGVSLQAVAPLVRSPVAWPFQAFFSPKTNFEVCRDLEYYGNSPKSCSRIRGKLLSLSATRMSRTRLTCWLWLVGAAFSRKTCSMVKLVGKFSTKERASDVCRPCMVAFTALKPFVRNTLLFWPRWAML